MEMNEGISRHEAPPYDAVKQRRTTGSGVSCMEGFYRAAPTKTGGLA